MTHPILPPLLLLAASAVLALSAAATLLMRRISLRIGYVDHPGGHKSHAAPTPYGGGVAIFGAAWLTLGMAVAAAALLPHIPAAEGWLARTVGKSALDYIGGVRNHALQLLVILAGGAALHVLGLVDDKRPLPPVPKLLAIMLVTLFVAWAGDVRVATFLGTGPALVLTVAWFVVIVNALNFLDNMDGLSAGVACICLAAFAVCGLMAGQVLIPGLAAVFVGAIGGFLIFNFPPARIFMGDAGSLVVGYMLAVVSTMTTYYQSGTSTPPYALAMPLIVLAVPLYDFTSVVIIRLLEGRNPLRGDQRHFSHRLVERGLGRRGAVQTIYLAAATTGLAATLLPGAGLRVTLTVGVIILCVLAIVAILEMPLRREA